MKSLMVVLTIAAILVFALCLAFGKRPGRMYLLFMLYAFPVIDLKLTPASWGWGGLSLFEGVSYVILCVRYKDFLSIFKENRFYFFAFCTLLFLLMLGSLASEFPFSSLLTNLLIIPIFIYARMLILECIRDDEFIYKMLNGLKFACLFSVVFLAAQMVIGLELRFYPELNQNTLDSSGVRYPGFFHDSQKFAQYLAMSAFIFLFNRKNIHRPVFKNLFFFLIVAIAIFFTGGRSAFLGLMAGIFFLLLFAGVQYKKYIIAGCLAGGIVIAFFSQSLILFQRKDDFNDSFNFRASIWQEAYKIYQSHPFLGIGIGNYKDYVSKYAQDQYLVLEDEIIFLDQPENGYLKILTEFGAPAFIVAFALILGPVIGAMRAWFKRQADGRIILFIAPVISWLVSFVSLYSISDRRNLLILLCLLCFLIYLSNRSKIVNDKEPDTTYPSLV